MDGVFSKFFPSFTNVLYLWLTNSYLTIFLFVVFCILNTPMLYQNVHIANLLFADFTPPPGLIVLFFGCLRGLFYVFFIYGALP